MKFVLILVAVFFTTIIARSQDLLKKSLSEADKKKGIVYKYAYDCSDSYCQIRLILYKDQTFKYAMKTFNKDVFSRGKWSKENDILIIKSQIQKNCVPVKLVYSNDTSGMINNFKVAVVRNTKGELMTDGLLRINNDSIQCLPMAGFCVGNYTSIDSLKVVFENGLSSQWLKIKDRKYNKIIPIVQTDFLMSSYMPLNRRYKILKSSIAIVDTIE